MTYVIHWQMSFALVAASWYELAMLKSYLAIVDQTGLVTFHEELEHTYDFLVRQVQYSCHIIVWAELPTEFLPSIYRQLLDGNRHNAWLLLQILSRQIGTLHTETAHRHRA